MIMSAALPRLSVLCKVLLCATFPYHVKEKEPNKKKYRVARTQKSVADETQLGHNTRSNMLLDVAKIKWSTFKRGTRAPPKLA